MQNNNPNIFRVWRDRKWSTPTIKEEFEPGRITLTLPLSSQKSDDKKATIKSDDKTPTLRAERQQNAIIEYLTEHPEGSVRELEVVLGLKATRVKALLSSLVDDGIIEAIGGNRNRKYRLKR